MRQGARLDQLPEIDPVDVLHDEIGSPLRVAGEVEDRDHVRMRELGGKVSFLDQHRREPHVIRQIRSQALDGNRAMKSARAPGDAQEHLRVTTDPDLEQELVALEPRCIEGRWHDSRRRRVASRTPGTFSAKTAPISPR
jgi:hypothetical protein